MQRFVEKSLSLLPTTCLDLCHGFARNLLDLSSHFLIDYRRSLQVYSHLHLPSSTGMKTSGGDVRFIIKDFALFESANANVYDIKSSTVSFFDTG